MNDHFMLSDDWSVGALVPAGLGLPVQERGDDGVSGAMRIACADALALLDGGAHVARFDPIFRLVTLPVRHAAPEFPNFFCNLDAPAITAVPLAFDWAVLGLLSHLGGGAGEVDIRLIRREGRVVMVIPGGQVPLRTGLRHAPGPGEVFARALEVLGARLDTGPGPGEMRLSWQEPDDDTDPPIPGQDEETI